MLLLFSSARGDSIRRVFAVFESTDSVSSVSCSRPEGSAAGWPREERDPPGRHYIEACRRRGCFQDRDDNGKRGALAEDLQECLGLVECVIVQ